MANFFKSFFSSGKNESTEEDKQKSDKKNFEIFKYDGLRAQRMGRPDYAVKCFTEALAIEEEFETMGYLSQLYIQMHELNKSIELLLRMAEMEPHMTSTFLTLAQVYYMQEAYAEMEKAAKAAARADENSASAYLLLAKASHGLKDDFQTIAHLTKAILLKDDYTEANLMRAEVLLDMHQPKEAKEDIDAVLAQNPEDETAILLHGKLNEMLGNAEAAEADYRSVTEMNPFNEQAFLRMGQLYITQNKVTEAIELFDEAIELNPNFAAAYNERGRAKLLNGDQAGSVEDMKKSLELNPKDNERFNGQFDNQAMKSSNVLGL